FATISAERGVARPVASQEETLGHHQTSVIVYSPQFAESEAARRFMVGYLKGLRDYNDAFVKHQNLDAVADVITEFSTTRDAALVKRVVPVSLNPVGYLNVKSIENDLEWYVAS